MIGNVVVALSEMPLQRLLRFCLEECKSSANNSLPISRMQRSVSDFGKRWAVSQEEASGSSPPSASLPCWTPAPATAASATPSRTTAPPDSTSAPPPPAATSPPAACDGPRRSARPAELAQAPSRQVTQLPRLPANSSRTPILSADARRSCTQQGRRTPAWCRCTPPWVERGAGSGPPRHRVTSRPGGTSPSTSGSRAPRGRGTRRGRSTSCRRCGCRAAARAGSRWWG